MVNFVSLLESTKNCDRALDTRLTHVYRLESTLERRILLDVLAVFIESRGADEAKLASSEHRLEHVASVHRAFGLSGTDERVHLVDKHDKLPFCFSDFLENCLQSLFEFAAELCASDERAEVEGEESLIAERFGDVTVHDALRESFRDCSLADTRLTDENGIILRSARKNLNHAANLFVPADDRIEFSLAGCIGEVASVTLKRLILIFGVLIRNAMTAADLLERLEECVACRA